MTSLYNDLIPQLHLVYIHPGYAQVLIILHVNHAARLRSFHHNFFQEKDPNIGELLQTSPDIHFLVACRHKKAVDTRALQNRINSFIGEGVQAQNSVKVIAQCLRQTCKIAEMILQ